ncbi:Sel1 repeat protein HcpA [Helicobacter pylori]|uniref:Sel1-like repeat protein HcpA n=2 Tax=Helicobacter pylori TaxID=210 RepID=UPI000BEA5F7B|nr:Sel1-like repeat protein HcpA [Helicobacter pylori]PDW57953.1 Sel1 repeat protein HcpA [Helicobacter pylori]
MLGSVQKTLFGVLCLGALCLRGLMAEPDAKELVNLGIESAKKQDFAQAKTHFEKACELKNGFGCVFLGAFYEEGKGVGKGLKKAIQFYTKGCELNDGYGCRLLGNLYYNGQGVSKDAKKASQYYSKACDLNHAEGCTVLGSLHHYGVGTPKDLRKALDLYEKACELKDSPGCINAGYIYSVTKNFKEAIVRYSKACELKDGRGCYNLGVMQYNAQGTAKDEKQAVENFKKGCKSGVKEACDALKELKIEL